MEAWRARDADVAAIQAARSGDPFAVLGPHKSSDGWVIRVFAPDAISVRAITLDGKLLAELPRREDDFFEALIPSLKERPVYRVEVETTSGTYSALDPYAFGPARGPLDDYLLREGSHRELYRRLGAQLTQHEGVEGVLFALWAPNATRASVVGDFNRWDGMPLPDAQAHGQRAVGDLRPSPRGRNRLQIRACGTRRRAVAA